MALRTDYKDDILDLTQNTQRKYRMITNADGTVSFEDVTAYSQVGDSFGAAELNEIANSVNEGGSNMYYDPETDIKYLKNQDGEWVAVGYGGLLYTYLIHNGQINVDLCGSLVGGTGGWQTSSRGEIPTITQNTENVTITTNGTFIDTTGDATFANMIDLTNFNSLNIEYSANVSLESGFIRRVPIVMFVGSANTGTFQETATSSAILLNMMVGSKNGKITLDLSNISGDFYIGFALYDQNYDGTNYIDTITSLFIYNMWLE